MEQPYAGARGGTQRPWATGSCTRAAATSPTRSCVAWVLAWALAGITAGRALDQVSEVTRSAEGAGAAVVRTGESIRDVDVPVAGPCSRMPARR